VRNVDRIVKDMQSQVERREKQNSQLQDDVARMRDKVDKLLQTIDELQASDSSNQLTARRAERELREEKERNLRLERELEGWKAFKGNSAGVGVGVGVNTTGGSGSVAGSLRNAGRAGTWRSAVGGVMGGGGVGGLLGPDMVDEEDEYDGPDGGQDGGGHGGGGGGGVMWADDGVPEVPRRKSSIRRVPSMTKGFL
jgi:myosin protein heavy chain